MNAVVIDLTDDGPDIVKGEPAVKCAEELKTKGSTALPKPGSCTRAEVLRSSQKLSSAMETELRPDKLHQTSYATLRKALVDCASGDGCSMSKVSHEALTTKGSGKEKLVSHVQGDWTRELIKNMYTYGVQCCNKHLSATDVEGSTWLDEQPDRELVQCDAAYRYQDLPEFLRNKGLVTANGSQRLYRCPNYMPPTLGNGNPWPLNETQKSSSGEPDVRKNGCGYYCLNKLIHTQARKEKAEAEAQRRESNLENPAIAERPEHSTVGSGIKREFEEQDEFLPGSAQSSADFPPSENRSPTPGPSRIGLAEPSAIDPSKKWTTLPFARVYAEKFMPEPRDTVTDLVDVYYHDMGSTIEGKLEWLRHKAADRFEEKNAAHGTYLDGDSTVEYFKQKFSHLTKTDEKCAYSQCSKRIHRFKGIALVHDSITGQDVAIDAKTWWEFNLPEKDGQIEGTCGLEHQGRAIVEQMMDQTFTERLGTYMTVNKLPEKVTTNNIAGGRMSSMGGHHGLPTWSPSGSAPYALSHTSSQGSLNKRRRTTQDSLDGGVRWNLDSADTPTTRSMVFSSPETLQSSDSMPPPGSTRGRGSR